LQSEHGQVDQHLPMVANTQMLIWPDSPQHCSILYLLLVQETLERCLLLRSNLNQET
jgi:hypothetical protein